MSPLKDTSQAELPSPREQAVRAVMRSHGIAQIWVRGAPSNRLEPAVVLGVVAGITAASWYDSVVPKNLHTAPGAVLGLVLLTVSCWTLFWALWERFAGQLCPWPSTSSVSLDINSFSAGAVQRALRRAIRKARREQRENSAIIKLAPLNHSPEAGGLSLEEPIVFNPMEAQVAARRVKEIR